MKNTICVRNRDMTAFLSLDANPLETALTLGLLINGAHRVMEEKSADTAYKFEEYMRYAVLHKIMRDRHFEYAEIKKSDAPAVQS